MNYLPIRSTLCVLALAVTACSDNAATDAVAPRAPRPSFALDLAAPPAPTNVTAELIPIDRYRATIRVSWMDNSTALDEFSTVVYATTADGASAGGEGLYATNYDLPPGSTGQRSGEVIASTSAAWVQLQTCRRFGSDAGGWRNVCGAASDPVAVTTPLTAATSKGKGKGHN